MWTALPCVLLGQLSLSESARWPRYQPRISTPRDIACAIHENMPEKEPSKECHDEAKPFVVSVWDSWHNL